jgi:hypothetical protein
MQIVGEYYLGNPIIHVDTRQNVHPLLKQCCFLAWRITQFPNQSALVNY